MVHCGPRRRAPGRRPDPSPLTAGGSFTQLSTPAAGQRDLDRDAGPEGSADQMTAATAGQSAPVVDDVAVAGAVARLVGTVHRHALEVPAKAPLGQHRPGAVTAGVRPSDQDRRAAVGGQSMACVDEQAEPAFRPGTRPDGTELDVAGARAGLRARADVADG